MGMDIFFLLEDLPMVIFKTTDPILSSSVDGEGVEESGIGISLTKPV